MVGGLSDLGVGWADLISYIGEFLSVGLAGAWLLN